MEVMLEFFSVARRRALLFVLAPGGLAALVGLAVAVVLGGLVAAALTAFAALVMLLIEMGSGLALVAVRPPPNRGSALAWGVLLCAGALLATCLLLGAFGTPQIR